MKKIMILGASVYQLPLIRLARERELYTIVVSRPGSYPAFTYADRAYYVDTTDEEAVLEIARKEQIDGICTAGTDAAVRAIGRICQELHLCGLSYASACRATDKALMKEAFLEGGVNCARPCKVYSLAEAAEVFQKMREDGAEAVMVKAVDSSGSRGITRVTSDEELRAAYQSAAQVTRKPYILLEDFLEGHEIGVDGFICDGEIRLLLPHEKYVLTTGGTTIPAGHGFPYVCTPELDAEIRRQTLLAIRATGLDNCAFNADVLIGDRVYMLEIGGRSGATGIPELISMHCGFSYYEKILECALGQTPDFTVQADVPCCSQVLFSPVSGTITQIRRDALHELEKDGAAISLDCGIGDAVSAVRNGTDRIGQFIIGYVPSEKLTEISRKIYDSIFVDQRPLLEYFQR